MKKFIFVSLLTLLLAFSFNAYSAEEGWYIGGNFGPFLLNDAELAALSEADLEDLIGEDLDEGSTGSIDIEYETGFNLNVAPGFDFGDFRLEGELAYQINDIDKVSASVTIPDVGSATYSEKVNGDVMSLTLLFNGYYDFRTDSAVQPYLTAGVGLARVDVQVGGESLDDSALAYQIGAGISYEMSENVALNFGYRYFATADIEFAGLEIENSGHSILFGVRYSF